MKPDPSRSWFVYHNEKESGPFTESELLKKLKSGQLDSSAYVFTEGMTDWALVSETDVLSAPEPLPSFSETDKQSSKISAIKASDFVQREASKVSQISKISQPSKVSQVSSQNSQSLSKITGSGGGATTEQPSRLTKTGSKKENTSTEKSPSPRKFKFPKVRPVYLGVFILVAVGVGGYFALEQIGILPLGKPHHSPIAEDAASTADQAPSESPALDKKPSKATSPEARSAEQNEETAAPSPRASTDIDWDELLAVKNSKDTKGPPYRLATKTLGQLRPIVVGVLSSLLKADKLNIAVYPDNDKNLMPVPRIWIFRVPVVDGFFSFGPLNMEGNVLPVGRYKVLVQMGKNFLGETAFDLGPWPSGTRLTQAQSQIQAERASLAEKERTALDLKMKEVNAAVDQLKTNSRFANEGPRGVRDWKRVAMPWRDALLKATSDQRSVMAGPMFYGDAQFKLYNFMKDIFSLYEALDIFSSGGAKALTRLHKKGLGQLWAQLAKSQSDVGGGIQALSQSAVAPLKIDPEIIKLQLAGDTLDR